MSADQLPVIERARLDGLAAELDSRDDALAFARTFLELLPRRVQSVSAAVGDGETDAAHVALVSLAASAEMVGALQLERDVRLADRALRAGNLVSARESVARLDDDADAVARALAELLDEP